MNLYNIMVTYDGEGETNIYVPGIGDTHIVNGRPIYLKNAGFNVVEALRQFRNMKINIKIDANSKGAFKIIDLDNTKPTQRMTPREEITSVSDTEISNILKAGTSGPIPVEPKKEEKVDYGSYKLPSGQFEGQTLTEVDKLGKLKSVYNGFKSRNPEVKEAIEKYYESLVK